MPSSDIVYGLCTFSDCQLEELPRHYHFYISSKEFMLQSGTDSKVQLSKEIIKKKENFRIHSWWDGNQDWFGINLVMDVIEPINIEILALTISKEGHIHVCYRTFFVYMVEGQESIL